MNDFFEKHRWLYYTLIFVVLLSINIFWRWRNGDAWTDVLLFSVLSTVLLGGGVILGDCLRRKNQAAKKKVEELLKND